MKATNPMPWDEKPGGLSDEWIKRNMTPVTESQILEASIFYRPYMPLTIMKVHK